MVLLDLYRSLDGFVHRRFDALAQRSIDRFGVARSLTGAVVALTPVAYALVHEHAASGFPPSTQAAAAILPSLFIAMPEFGSAMDDLRYGPNETFDEGSLRVRHEGRYRVDRGVRALRLVPVAIGVACAAHGAASLIEGATRGTLSAEGLASIALGAAVLGPSASSYLRDRDPPAPQEDPMHAYPPARLERIVDP